VFLLNTAAFAEPEQIKASRKDPKIELEVSAGATARTQLTPTVSARVGVDFWNSFTPSVRVLSVAPWALNQRGPFRPSPRPRTPRPR
jgi:hypothetical protein